MAAMATKKADTAKTAESPRFTVAELEPYAEELFGCPPQVLTGARSAGLLVEPTTKDDAQKAVDKYLKLPADGRGS